MPFCYARLLEHKKSRRSPKTRSLELPIAPRSTKFKKNSLSLKENDFFETSFLSIAHHSQSSPKLEYTKILALILALTRLYPCNSIFPMIWPISPAKWRRLPYGHRAWHQCNFSMRSSKIDRFSQITPKISIRVVQNSHMGGVAISLVKHWKNRNVDFSYCN